MRSLLPQSSDLRLFLSLMFLGGCGSGDGIILPSDGEPAEIAILEGDKQKGRVGEPLNDPLVVEVTDARGRPVSGATVAFELTSAGSAVVPHEKRTNANGLADARVQLGTTVGRQTGKARVVTPEGRPPVQADFTAMALSEDAISMAAVAGQDQTGHVGQPLDDRLVVEVTDGFGNPVAGVPITWSAEGGGTVSEGVVPTDEDGRSRVERTLGPAVGQQTTVASSGELAGSPVTFVHTALAGDASRLVIVSGNDQTAEAGTTLPEDPVVRLVDSEGNGVPGTAVTWLAAIGGGSVAPENTTTDGDGRTSARWTLGGTLGDQRLDAVVSGVGVASFHATATASAPASIFIRTQPSATARNGVPLGRQPVVQLRDASGNDAAVAGVEVTVELGGGGELGGTSRRSTDAAGRAAFDDLSISGAPGRRTLVFRATGYAQATSDEIDLQAVGTTTTITADSPDPSGAGSTFPVQVRVASDGPTPTGSVTITVSGGTPSCTATLTGGVGSCSLTLNTVGDRTLTDTYSGAPGFSASADTEPHRVESTQPPPPAGTVTTITADGPDPSVAGAAFPVRFTVTANGSTPTGNVTVTVSGGNATCTGTLSCGAGSCELTLNGLGDRTLTATYSGGPGFSGSSDTEPHRVDPRPPENEEPFADFNWTCEGLTCHFTDNSRDDDGNQTITSRHWDFGDGATTDNVLNPSHTYPAPGEYTVVLRVTDNGGLTDESSDEVDPEAPPPPNQPPTAEFTWQCDDLDCEFDGESDDSDGQVVSREWTFGDGGTSDDGNPSHEYSAEGTYTVRFTVTDDDGATGFVEHSVTVNAPNQEPTAEFTWTCTNLECQFTGQGNDSDGSISSWSWDFKDGGSSSAQSPLHSFPGTGTYAVELTVTDNEGASQAVQHSVSVTAPPENQPPAADPDGYSTPGGGTALTVGAPGVLANDSDPEGTPLSAQSASVPSQGAVLLSPDGSFTYTPAPGATGVDSFTYQASDGSLQSSATVTVTITP